MAVTIEEIKGRVYEVFCRGGHGRGLSIFRRSVAIEGKGLSGVYAKGVSVTVLEGICSDTAEGKGFRGT